MTFFLLLCLNCLKVSQTEPSAHRRSQGGKNIVVLCFERRLSKQNSVIRLKSSILAPQKIPPPFLGWLRHCLGPAGGHEQRLSLGSCALILHNPSVTMY